jgi:hypothetical protein
MDFNKPVKFKIGSEDWEMPLGTLLLLIAIALLLMIGGAYMGFKFGERQFQSSNIPQPSLFFLAEPNVFIHALKSSL